LASGAFGNHIAVASCSNFASPIFITIQNDRSPLESNADFQSAVSQNSGLLSAQISNIVYIMLSSAISVSGPPWEKSDPALVSFLACS
jgi:hypothetical protein